MKRLLTNLLLVLFSFAALAQQNVVDSLENQLKVLPADTNRVHVMISLLRKLRRSDANRSFEMGENAIALSQELGYKRGEVVALYNIGVSMGMKGDYPMALQYFRNTLQEATAHEVTDYVSSAHSGMGIVYKRMGDYSAALEHYLINLQLSDSLNDVDGTANVYSNLGVLYDLMKEYDKAKASYQEAYLIYDELKDKEGLLNINSNLGVLYYNQKDYQTAAKKFEEVLSLSDNADKDDQCLRHMNLGLALLNLGNYLEAETHLLIAYQLAEEMDYKQEKINAYRNMADLRLKQGRIEDALVFLEKNLEEVKGVSSYDLKKQSHDMASEVFRKSGQFDKAFEHTQLYILYKDSLFNQNKVAEFERQQVLFETYKKDQELEAQQAALELLGQKVALEKNFRIALAVIIGMLLLLLLLFLLRYKGKKKVATLLEEKNTLITQQKEAIQFMNEELEKRMLRAQMNPHFIFNSLSSIQHFITSDDKKSALKYLSKFSSLLRQVLESSIHYNVLLSEEIKLLTIYLELEALRFDNDFEYNIAVDPQLEQDVCEVPILLVQPYVENAIIHGLMPKTDNRVLKVCFEGHEEYILCTIEDNGMGRKAASKSSKNRPSRGMSVTKQRLEVLSSGQDASLVQIYDLKDEHGAPKGTKVVVKIPKN